jgi:ferredoxin
MTGGCMMKIVVDFDLCQSHGLCTEAAPKLFELRDDGFLYVLNETPGQDEANAAEKAALECPTGAITIQPE